MILTFSNNFFRTIFGIATCIVLQSACLPSYAQLSVSLSSSAVAMASTITGSGVTVINQVLDCSTAVACGTFSVASGTTMGTGTTVWGINSGIVLTTGHALAAAGAESGTTSFSDGFGGDPAMATLALTASTYDRCELSFDFIPQGDSVSFNYIFGSEEYIHSTCGSYDDAFAFFISGPGITGTQNMALVPGTTVPVMVNTINCGAPCINPTYGTLSNCTSIAAGSPFTAYYVDNTGGSYFAYRGYTTKLRAASAVTACDTYHLKMAIVDAGNHFYDSGVFIEAGSLNSSSVHFDHTAVIGSTIEGIPNAIVKGCTGTNVKVIMTPAPSSSSTIALTYGGTGVRSTDYTSPTTVTIAAGDTSATFTVNGLATVPAGTKTVTIYLSASCGGYVDSVTLNLLDTPTAAILTPDTAICGGGSFTLRTSGTSGLTYSWSPSTSLSSSTAADPTASPTSTTIYTMTATLPGSGCPPIVKEVAVSESFLTASILTPDTTTCGGSFTIRTSGSGGGSYTWSPSSSLSSGTVADPIASPTVTTTYTLTVSSAGAGCPPIIESVTVTVDTYSARILTPDTVLCSGSSSFTLRTSGSAGLTYSWSPAATLSSATSPDPTATPVVTTTYTMTATPSVAGCAPVEAEVTVSLVNLNIAMLSPDTSICAGDSVQLSVAGSPTYTYAWTPATGLSSSTIQNPKAGPTITTTYVVSASLPGSGCPPVTASMTIQTHGITISVPYTSFNICSGDSVQLLVSGSPAFSYSWTPATGLSSSTAQEPWAKPTSTTYYSVTADTPGASCPPVTLSIAVNVYDISFGMPNDTTVCSGDTVQLQLTGTNPGYTYSWTPSATLDNAAIANPHAAPTTTTTYSVTVNYPVSTCPAVTKAVTVQTESIAISTPTTPLQICEGQSVTLNVSGSPTPLYVYNWSPAQTLSSANQQDPTATPSITTIYTVTASLPDAVCPSVYGTETVIVIPTQSVTATTDSVSCTNSKIDLFGGPYDPSYSFAWSGPNGFSSTLQNPSIDSPVSSDQGWYYLNVTNTTTGCVYEDSVYAIYGGKVMVHLTNVTTSPQNIMYGKTLLLNADSAQFFSWYPDDGTLSNPNVNDPIAAPLKNTTYYVIGINQYGCRDTDSVVVNLIYDTVMIPTAFTPNGDGLNDIFRVVNLGFYKLVSMRVFDRWGNMVYENLGSENGGWDGTYKGVPMDVDVYYYYIELMKPNSSELLTYKGDISLIR